MKYIQLALGTIILLLLGVVYSWSLFVKPLEIEFGWSSDQTSLIFSLEVIFFSLGGIFGGSFNRRFGYRKMLVFGAVGVFIGFFLCSNVTLLWQIYVAYGLISGFSIGVVYNVVIHTVNTWFLSRIGFSSGVLMMGYGVGSLVLGAVVNLLNASLGFRYTFLFLAITYGIFIIICSFILKRMPEGYENSTERNKVIPVQRPPVVGPLSPGQLFKSPSFYCFFFWSSLCSSIGFSVAGHASVMAASVGAAGALLVIATGSYSIANGASRVIFGLIYDKKGRHTTMFSVTILGLIAVLLMILALFMGSLPLLIISFLIAGLCFGGIVTCNSAVTKELYGFEHYGANFSLMSSPGIVASLLGSYGLGVLLVKTESYLNSVPILLVFVAGSFVIEYFMTKKYH